MNAATATTADHAGHAGSASFLWTITPQIVTVPNALGLQKGDAIVAMESLGLVLDGISLNNGCRDIGGAVVLQYPSERPFVLIHGASFRLTVSSDHDSTWSKAGTGTAPGSVTAPAIPDEQTRFCEIVQDRRAANIRFSNEANQIKRAFLPDCQGVSRNRRRVIFCIEIRLMRNASGLEISI